MIPTHHFVAIAARTRVALAGLDEGLDVRAVEVRSASRACLRGRTSTASRCLLEMELLGRERAALRERSSCDSAVEVGSLDGAVVLAGDAHVGPVDVSCLDIDDDPVGQSAIRDEHLAVRAVRIQRDHTAVAEVEKEQAAHCRFVAGHVAIHALVN